MRIAPRGGRCHRQSGFTLLEMLVALTVLGFLMVALTQGVRTGLDLWGAQDRRIGATAELDSTARVLRTLLTGMPNLSTAAPGAGGATIASLVGKADQVTFIGDLPTGLGGTQRAKITLMASGGRLVLLWVPFRHELGGATPAAPSETELTRDVDRLRLAYWGETSPGAPAGWLAEWNEPVLPTLIRVHLTFAKGDGRIWPDLIAAPQLWAPSS